MATNEQYSWATKNKFSMGELSPMLAGRQDMKLYQAGVAKMVNFMILPSGATTRRHGTNFSNYFEKARLRVMFSHIINRHNQNLVFISDITDKKDIDSSDPKKRKIRVEVRIAHRKIEVVGEYKDIKLDKDEFRFFNSQGFTYLNFGHGQPIYSFHFNDNKYIFEKYKIDGEKYKKVANKEVTYQSIFRDSTKSEDKDINGELKAKSTNPDKFKELTSDVVTSFEGRLWCFGGKENLHAIQASALGDKTKFNLAYKSLLEARSPLSAFSVTFTSDTIDEVLWAVPLGDTMLVATTDGIYVLKTGDRTKDEFVKIHKEIDKSVSKIQPVILGKTIFFTDSDCKQIYNMSYSSDKGGYIVGSITKYAEHLFDKRIIKMIGVSSPFPMIFVHMHDGSLNHFTYDEEGKNMGWSQHYLGGSGQILDICLRQHDEGEDIFFHVRRPTINFVEYYQDKIERAQRDISILEIDLAANAATIKLKQTEIKEYEAIVEKNKKNHYINDLVGLARRPISETREYVEYFECKHLIGKVARDIHTPVYADCYMHYKTSEQRDLDVLYDKAMKTSVNYDFKEDLTGLEVLVTKRIENERRFDLTDQEIIDNFKVGSVELRAINLNADEHNESGIEGELEDKQALYVKFIREYFTYYQRKYLMILALEVSLIRLLEKIQTYSTNVLLGEFNYVDKLHEIQQNVLYVNKELNVLFDSIEEWHIPDFIKNSHSLVRHASIGKYKFVCNIHKSYEKNLHVTYFFLKTYTLDIKVVSKLYCNSPEVFIANKKKQLLLDFMRVTNSNYLNLNLEKNIERLDLMEVIKKKKRTDDLQANSFINFKDNLDILDLRLYVLDKLRPDLDFIEFFKVTNEELQKEYQTLCIKYEDRGDEVNLPSEDNSEDELSVTSVGSMTGRFPVDFTMGADANKLLERVSIDGILGFIKYEICKILMRLNLHYDLENIKTHHNTIKDIIEEIFKSFLNLMNIIGKDIKDELYKLTNNNTLLRKTIHDSFNHYRDNKDSDERKLSLELEKKYLLDKYINYLNNGHELPEHLEDEYKEKVKEEFEKRRDFAGLLKDYKLYLDTFIFLEYIDNIDDLKNYIKNKPKRLHNVLIEKWKDITNGQTSTNTNYEIDYFTREVIEAYGKVKVELTKQSDLVIWNILAKIVPESGAFQAFQNDFKTAKKKLKHLREEKSDYYVFLSGKLDDVKNRLNKFYTNLVRELNFILPSEKFLLASYLSDTKNPTKIDKFLFFCKDYFPIFRMNFPDIDIHTIKSLTTNMDTMTNTIHAKNDNIKNIYAGTDLVVVGDEEEVFRFHLPFEVHIDYTKGLGANYRFVSLGFPYRSVLKTFPFKFPEESDAMFKVDTSISIKFFNTKGGYIEETTSKGDYKKQYVIAPIPTLDDHHRFMGDKAYLIAEALNSISTPYITGWVHFSYNREISSEIDVMYGVDRPYPVTIQKITAKAKLVPHAIN